MKLSRRCARVYFKGGTILPEDVESAFHFKQLASQPLHKTILPFSLAAVIHLLLVGMIFISPMHLFRQPQAVDVYTVKIFRVTEIEQPAKPTAPPPVTATKSDDKGAEVISLSPKKLKKKNLKSKEEQQKRELALNKRLASIKANLEAQKAKIVAHEAAQEAIAKLKKTYQHAHNQSLQHGPITSDSPLTAAQKEYFAAIVTKIQSNWILPNLPGWDEALEGIVVLKVDKQGKIVKTFFEKKTDNIYFNNFVEKTIRLSEPLPPFPAEFEEKELEIGLRFRPGEIL